MKNDVRQRLALTSVVCVFSLSLASPTRAQTANEATAPPAAADTHASQAPPPVPSDEVDADEVDADEVDANEQDDTVEVVPHLAPADGQHAGPPDDEKPADEDAPGGASRPKTVPLTPVKERADTERADKENADKERADKERADKENADATDATGPASGLPAPAAGGPAKPRVILLRLDAANVDDATVRIIQGLLTSAASRQPGVELVTLDDLAKSLDVESERQALSCDDEVVDSCLAEIAGAMGARYIAYGQVGRLGELTLLQLHLFDSDRARSINRVDLKVNDVQDLAELMDDAVSELFAPLTGETGGTSHGLPVGGGLLGAAGVSLVIAVAGGSLFGVGLYLARQANNRTVYDPAHPAAVNSARRFALLGNVGSVVGVAGLVGAIVLAGAGAATIVILE